MCKTKESGMPTAKLAINKSRIKVYNKQSEVPTYYLQKGQEFQIELFNPTKDTILAKIQLNGTPIGQGGLVLRQGERVFLDRYIDVAKKFKFDTYEVSNTSEVRKAIEDNGDLTVQFFKEYIKPIQMTPQIDLSLSDFKPHVYGGNHGWNDDVVFNNLNDMTFNCNNIVGATSNASLDFSDIDLSQNLSTLSRGISDSAPAPSKFKGSPVKGGNPIKRFKKKTRSRSEKIETGRVEQGAKSEQTMDIVYKDWLTTPFYSLEYKLLPESQKVTTVQDVQTKRYCTECGQRNKPTFKFCPSCGAKC